MALSTVIADVDPLARRLIRSVLERAGVEVLGEAGDAAEAAELVHRLAPDVALVDSVEAVHAVRRRSPAQRLVVLARAECDDAAVAALLAGAAGYLPKDVELDALPRALAAVADGEAAVSRRLTRRLVERYRARPRLRPIKGPLTAREWEILDLLAPGRTIDEIADRLFLSPETVRSHVKSIMRKLDVHSRHDALAAAERLRPAEA